LFSPVNGGSGVAVSSDAGLLFNPASNTLTTNTFSAGVSVATVAASVSGSTASTTTTTGALVVTGGVGIGQSVSVGGRLQMFNGANYTAFVSSASGNTVYTLPATSPATGSSVLQSDSAGVLSWVPMTATGGASGNTTQNIVVNSAGNASAFHPILFTPASLSAGSAVSSDGTISFNPSTEILNVSGLAITATTASTSTSNGALQVAGGVGISGRLSFNQASFGTTGIATNPTMAMIGQTGDPIFMSVLEDNSISFEGTQGQLFSITPNLSTGYIYSVNDITGIPLIRANANANVTANEYAGNFGIGLTNPGYKLHVLGSVGFTSTTSSTSTTTGTLIVGGGVGIGGSLYVASATAISGVTINNGIITGSLTGTATTSGFATTSNYSNQSGYGITAGLATTSTYSHQAGYAITSGSASIATTATYSHQAGYAITSGNSNTSGYATTAGFATTASNLNVVSALTNSNHQVLFTPTSGSASGVAVSSNGTLVYNPSTDRLSTSGLAVTSGTASTNSTTGALVVTGGVGIGGSLFVAGDLTINGTTTTINTVTLTVDDKNIELGSVVTPSDVTAEGGGITLKGATDKSINWYTGTGWSSSESWNLVSGSTYKINNTTVLSNSSLGTGVTNSSLTALGSITTGVWSGTSITAFYGGTGLQTTFTIGDLLYANTASTWNRLSPGTNGFILVSAGTANTPAYTNPATLTIGTATTATNVNIVAASTSASHPVLFTPTSGSASGIAVSSNSTLVYNPSTDILSVSGMAVTSSTASTTTTTGSLIATGGVGIGQSASIGGRLQLFNGANYTAFVSSATGNTVYTLPATSPATGSSVLQSTSAGVMSWVAMAAGAASGNTAQNIVINTAGNANVFHPILFTPSSLSAGSAVSSDSTISFNPSTEILNVSGLAITSGTASTNTTTGALVVRGGLGVTGQLSFAQASFGFTGITTNPTMSFIGATSASPITLTVLTDNSLNFEGSQGSVFSIDSNLSSGEIFSVSDISGLPIISASAGQTVNINEFGGFTQIGNGSINSSSTTTGSLVVSGGLGLTGNANIGGTVRITNTTASTSTTTGALVVVGGVGIGGSIFGASTISAADNIEIKSGKELRLNNSGNTFYTGIKAGANTSNTTYTFPTAFPGSGTSVLQSTSAGVMSWISTAGLGASSGGALDGSVQYKSGSGFGGTRSFFFNATTNGLRLGNFPGEELPTSTNAALLIEQTIGSFNGSVDGTLIAANAISDFNGDLINLQKNAITKFKVDANGAIGTSSSFNAGGDISVTSTTQATNTITGALKVAGGVGIGQTLFVGGSISNANYFYSGGNNFTKSGQAQGDIFLDNNSNDTPGVLYYYKNNTNFGIDAYATGIGSTRLRIVKDLNESGGAELWSIDRTGVVTQTAWAPGEIIKMTVLVGADLTGGSTTTISTSSDTDVASYSYTPVSSNSYLVIEFTTRYFVVGAAADDYVSRIAVDGAEQSYNVQVWTNGAGGGTRSGTLFPLMARYTNSNTTAKTISATVRKGTTDDNATVYKDTTTVMKITEIGR
jgi:hypothetical protein